jgi:Haemolysin-III related/Leucine Rich repeat
MACDNADNAPLGRDQKRYQANVSTYIANCKKFGVTIDSSVVISLQSGWDLLQPSNQFAEGAMLPLIGILEENDHIRKVNLNSVGMRRWPASGNGNSNARALRSIIKKNTTIEHLDLSNNGLDDDGIREICNGIKQNSTIKSLNLSSNHFGEIGAEQLRLALEENTSIKTLDISRNALGFRSISSLLCSCRPRGLDVATNGNFVFEEILNSVSHGIAFILAVVGANVLISKAADSQISDYHFWACVLYSFSLMFLFLGSCLFHSFFMMPKSKSFD